MPQLEREHVEADARQRDRGGYRELRVEGTQGLFRCLWENRVSGEGGVAKRVLPDNCADFIVSSSGRAWLVGPATRFEIPRLEPGSVLRGLRIATAAIRAVTDTDATELTDRTIPIEDVLSSRRSRLLIDALATGTVSARSLASLWPDLTVAPAVRVGVEALVAHPRGSVSEVAADLAFSPRHFRRLVQQETGLAPKTIQRVGRVQRVLALAQPRATTGGDSLSMLAFDAGFADQAHLARDVRALAGLTPRQLVARHGHGRG